ncbi:hypothetical protein P8H27_09730 [Pseudomonas sp. sp1636]|uniref:hypothetical protein n=1 Tax=Pseudomonas sp. sp1636 TaxID=3036707 RepID=UPI0025A5C97B|nr:hypothetical protein [Pseudomonas sp. sp1636]MDM8349182.1 hypothetical protein [Pseudomonas sp. sp1636]
MTPYWRDSAVAYSWTEEAPESCREKLAHLSLKQAFEANPECFLRHIRMEWRRIKPYTQHNPTSGIAQPR